MTTNPEDPTAPTREPDPVPDSAGETPPDGDDPPDEKGIPLNPPPLPRS